MYKDLHCKSWQMSPGLPTPRQRTDCSTRINTNCTLWLCFSLNGHGRVWFCRIQSNHCVLASYHVLSTRTCCKTDKNCMLGSHCFLWLPGWPPTSPGLCPSWVIPSLGESHLKPAGRQRLAEAPPLPRSLTYSGSPLSCPIPPNHMG